MVMEKCMVCVCLFVIWTVQSCGECLFGVLVIFEKSRVGKWFQFLVFDFLFLNRFGFCNRVSGWWRGFSRVTFLKFLVRGVYWVFKLRQRVVETIVGGGERGFVRVFFVGRLGDYSFIGQMGILRFEQVRGWVCGQLGRGGCRGKFRV